MTNEIPTPEDKVPIEFTIKEDLHKQPPKFIVFWVVYQIFVVLNSLSHILFWLFTYAIMYTLVQASLNHIFLTQEDIKPYWVYQYVVMYMILHKTGVIASIQKWIEKEAEKIGSDDEEEE